MNRFNRLISLADAGRKYGKHESTLRTLISRGRFKEGVDCKKFGKQWVFDEDALDKFYSRLAERNKELEEKNKELVEQE